MGAVRIQFQRIPEIPDSLRELRQFPAPQQRFPACHRDAFQQALPLDFSLSANVIAMGRNYSLQGWSSGMSMAMIGLTKSFLDDRLGISINYTLPLTGGKGMEMRSVSEGKDFRSVSVNTIPMQQLNFSISWSFGKQGNARVKSARKTIKNDDVMNTESTSESLGTSMMGGGMGMM